MATATTKARARRICRWTASSAAAFSLVTAGWCYVQYRLDHARLREVALQITEASDSPDRKVLDLMHWVHEQGARTSNGSYFVVRGMRATPLQVLDAGGDCADKSRLLTTLLHEVGIPATMAMCFDASSGKPAHTFVEAQIGDNAFMAVDPTFDLYFPREESAGYHDLLDLRRSPEILSQRIERLCAESSQSCDVFRYYAGPSTEYDSASSINWNRNAFVRLLHDCLRTALGDAVYRIPRPSVLEEPQLFVAGLGAIPGLAGVFVLVGAARMNRRARSSASSVTSC